MARMIDVVPNKGGGIFLQLQSTNLNRLEGRNSVAVVFSGYFFVDSDDQSLNRKGGSVQSQNHPTMEFRILRVLVVNPGVG
jgi:hypothetical protein